MKSMQELQQELQVNLELTDLLEVLKAIAVSQFQALEKERTERFDRFSAAFEGFFEMIDFGTAAHPFSEAKGNLGIIMITSDEGFMGGLNRQVIELAMDYPGANDAELIVVGEKGADLLRETGHEFRAFPGIKGEERYEAALNMRDYIMKEGLSGRFGRLILVHPKPLSLMSQTVEILQILPCTELFEREREAAETVTEKEYVIVESPLSSIIEYLVSTWITEKLFQVFEDSKLAEFLARTARLEESYQVLLKRSETARQQYFRSRHEFIDKGMRETFSAQIMRKKAKKLKARQGQSP